VEVHNRVVQREFASQAATFDDPAYVFADERILDWILAHVPVEPDFTVLDVAAGAGHLARAVAGRARHVIALDITPEMLERGKSAADAASLTKVTFERGDAAALPYVDDSFDLVVCRFAVHHFSEPRRQITEMVRVCRPGGRVAVIDLVAVDPAHAARHNEFERLRDPSHTEALSAAVMSAQIEASGASVVGEVATDRQLDFERWIAQAGTPGPAAAKIRAALEAELDGGPQTGMRPARDREELRITQRWAIFLAAVGSAQ
jgi:ubiquinone/menaquinone biosynthesis C-methylase UbiE